VFTANPKTVTDPVVYQLLNAVSVVIHKVSSSSLTGKSYYVEPREQLFKIMHHYTEIVYKLGKAPPPKKRFNQSKRHGKILCDGKRPCRAKSASWFLNPV
jgi:hypothetical protein